ncbi:MAG: LysR family transcriptional regulator [Sphingobium sp.]|nr:LysR family transcriptional regulator [Sphingobium sp.]
MPLPPLAAVRAFEAAARLLNFTEAARELGMTQAAVSYQIKLLEERLGTTLFDRVGRRIELSPQGQALAPVIIRAFDEMRSGFASLSMDNAAVLTISCSNSFAHLWLAPRIGHFQMRQPNLAVRIHASNTLVDLARERVDVAVRGSAAASWPGLDAEFLAPTRIAPMCSPDFIERCGPFEKAEGLLKAVRLSPEDYWWNEWFEAMGVDEMSVAGPPPLVLDSQQMEGRAAMAGQGIAILSPFFWRAEIEAGQLVEPITSYVIETRRYRVVYPHANRNLPKVKAFRDWIREEMTAERTSDPEGRFIPLD